MEILVVLALEVQPLQVIGVLRRLHFLLQGLLLIVSRILAMELKIFYLKIIQPMFAPLGLFKNLIIYIVSYADKNIKCTNLDHDRSRKGMGYNLVRKD